MVVRRIRGFKWVKNGGENVKRKFVVIRVVRCDGGMKLTVALKIHSPEKW